ncbi:ribulose-phosphate 3-epimerase [Aerococcus urinaeequi]|uniref:ribulose-phosphate 3-epimerase n=1 Tax=Aerococcus urinaeequi TaxID=51665 RepID=UPI003B3AB304
MVSRYIIPSMMCANFENLKAEVQNLDVAGADIFHIDIMDGSFVPNFGMGLQDLEAIRATTQKPVDVHLMVTDPGGYIDLFAKAGVNIIYVHPETDPHPARTLDKIRKEGIKVGLAINPGTSLSTVEPLLNLVDYLMIMTVNPGFAGQSYLEYVNDKIIEATELATRYKFEIMVDGAISPEKIEYLGGIGVSGFVLGTSALFGKNEEYSTLIDRYKKV